MKRHELLDQERQRHERIWLANVFKNNTYNERPVINTIFHPSCDTQTSSYQQSATSGMNLNSDFEVLHNSRNKAYLDRDNPNQHTWQPHELEWIKHDSTKWKPTPQSSTIHSLRHDDPLTFMQNEFPQHHFEPITSLSQSNIHSVTNADSRIEIFSAQQSDSGANTSATNNISLLHDVTYIKPLEVNSATKESPMRMQAIGRLHIRTITGQVLKPICYYSSDITGTIISPDAIARQYSDQIRGFRKICNCHTDRGYLIFTPSDDEREEMIIPLYSLNGLWYHKDMSYTTTSHHTQPSGKTIHKLSTAASFELWHQRLCHPGSNAMQTIHKHCDGIPQLRGNSFWKCASCLSGKSDKTYHTRPKQVPFKDDRQKSKLLSTKEPEDKFLIPESVPGQHFHFDFGFMRTKYYQQEDQDGKLQTSVDGKNAYLLVIDRNTRYMWVYVSSSKSPPIEFCRSILRKFKAETAHRTVRCDQGELATSKEFNALLVEQGFTLQVTGSNNSKQNGMVERPHRTLKQMVRCILHNASLGPEFWSYALIHSVYVKNRLPHSSIKMSPFQHPDMQ